MPNPSDPAASELAIEVTLGACYDERGWNEEQGQRVPRESLTSGFHAGHADPVPAPLIITRFLEDFSEVPPYEKLQHGLRCNTPVT